MIEIVQTAEQVAAHADQYVMRSYELQRYLMGAAQYQALIDATPSEWPERLQQFADMPDDVAATQVDEADRDLLTQLKMNKRSREILAVEQGERMKVELMRGAIWSTLVVLAGSTDAAEAAVNEAVARQNAVQAAAQGGA